MYIPAHFRENDAAALTAFIAAHPFAALVAAPPSGLLANHLPLLARQAGDASVVLAGHVAKANALSQLAANTEVLAIFRGADHYVSPSWYAAKAETGKVVPTWNYSVVHAHGRIRFISDPSLLRAHLTALTERHEASRPSPWKISDAPSDYIEGLLGLIVGFEIAVERLEGKAKASQNRSLADRDGVERGLAAEGVTPEARAALVRR